MKKPIICVWSNSKITTWYDSKINNNKNNNNKIRICQVHRKALYEISLTPYGVKLTISAAFIHCAVRAIRVLDYAENIYTHIGFG